MRDGLPEGTVVREGHGWCMGRDVEVMGRWPYSFKTCWSQCAEEYPDTVAIDGLPSCYCQDRCEEVDCDGQSIVTRNNVEPGPCRPKDPDELPHFHGKASPQLYPPSSVL